MTTLLHFSTKKVDKIQKSLKQQRSISISSVNDMSVLDQSDVSCSLSEFDQLSVDDVAKIINGFSAKHCS